jgi:hypothetical protein
LTKQNNSAKKIHTDGVPRDMNSDEETELFIGTLHVNSVDNDKSDWTETLTINDHNIVFKLDTGAQANIIPKLIFDKLDLPGQQLTKTKVSYGGTEISSEGAKSLECSVRSRKYDLPSLLLTQRYKLFSGKRHVQILD